MFQGLAMHHLRRSPGPAHPQQSSCSSRTYERPRAAEEVLYPDRLIAFASQCLHYHRALPHLFLLHSDRAFCTKHEGFEVVAQLTGECPAMKIFTREHPTTVFLSATIAGHGCRRAGTCL